MTTQFFERQETQKSYTRWLVWGFITAILAVVAVINLVVLLGVGGDPMRTWRETPELFIGVSALVAGTIVVSSWYKSARLRAGGWVVARSLGGEPVTPNDTDFRRKRLLNVVEEMAIAARIRKPQVYVLVDEPGINAFAAGHSPDEAAVGITQGALDRLDRDQLQAVIGHEFSHILNGDMRINMRLTAWIFGLYVITDLARRIVRRSRGKDAARVRLVAFGVFLAGSLGLFAGRLLQAAVSRRREHLADASAVQFTRNPQALQSAFVAIAAHAEGTRLQHAGAADVAHMFFASNDPAWAHKFGSGWFATHPPIEERVRALDPRLTPARFKSLVNDERRKISAAAAAAAAAQPGDESDAGAGTGSSGAGSPVSGALTLAIAGAAASAAAASAPVTPAGSTAATMSLLPGDAPAVEHPEVSSTGIRRVGGRTLAPDVLRNRLGQEQQGAILRFIAGVEQQPVSVQATYIAALLSTEPAKARTQLTRLAPVLGIELLKETQAQAARLGSLASASRMPMLIDLLPLLEDMDPSHLKRLRAVARAFAPTVAPADMLRFGLTRLLEKRLSRSSDTPAPPPVPLGERAREVCDLYAALAHCRFGPGKQGQNSYRAGLMGMLPPQKWAPFPETTPGWTELDAALAGIAQIHPTGRRSFSEGMARVIAVGGRLTVSQVDLLRATCVIVDCALPVLPVDLVYDEAGPQAPQVSAR